MRHLLSIPLLILTQISLLVGASEQPPVIGTWTGRLTDTMLNASENPQKQRLERDVTLVVARINNGNPVQDGQIICGLYIWNGLPIGGPPELGTFQSAGMNMPEPVGRDFGASASSVDAMLTLTLIGKANEQTLNATGHYLSPWAVHEFTIHAHRYVGPVDEYGLPIPPVPHALGALERSFPWFCDRNASRQARKPRTLIDILGG